MFLALSDNKVVIMHSDILKNVFKADEIEILDAGIGKRP